MGVTGAILAITAASAAYQVYQGEETRKDAKKERRRQQVEQGRLERELEERELNEQALETGKNLRARNQSGGGYLKRGGTLLTSPLGAPPAQTTGNKTLLGG